MVPVKPAIAILAVSWREWHRFAPKWEHIHGSSPEASFFLSRAWVECWLAIFGKQLRPELLTFWQGGNVVGCCLLVWRTKFVLGIPFRRVYLNCAGEDDNDSTYIEFNSLLALEDFREGVEATLARYLRRRYWDELHLSGMTEVAGRSSSIRLRCRTTTKEVPSRFVDYSAIRECGGDYLDVLGAKTRKHIRRTHRACEEVGGECTAQFAGDVAEALDMLRQLATLHQARWEARGEPGCFSSERFRQFHELLIQRSFDKTLLFRVKYGDQVVGLLYCFVDKGWTYLYQSGFDFSLDHRNSPGLLTLYHFVNRCVTRPGFRGLDFMAGDSDYKRQLTNALDYRLLRWYVVRRNTIANVFRSSARGVAEGYLRLATRNSNNSQEGRESP